MKKITRIVIKSVSLCGALCILMFIGGCAAHSVKSKILVPAKYNEAAQLRRVAVLPFVYNKRKDNNTTAEIEATITSVRIDDRSYFSVIERSRLNKIIDEQRLGSTGLIDQKTAVRVGRIAGVEAVLMGNITQFGVDRRRDYETRSSCSRRNADGKCIYRTKRRVSCITRTATFSFVPKLINVSTGKLIVSESFSHQEESRECDNQRGPSDNELLNTVKSASLIDFKNAIAPHYVSQKLVLLSPDDTKLSESAKNKIDGGIAFAEAGRMDRACTIWKEAANEYHTTGYVLPYLMGICAEIEGDLVNAMEYYRSADQHTMSPVNEINDALARINKKHNDQSKLAKQQLFPDGHNRLPKS